MHILLTAFRKTKLDMKYTTNIYINTLTSFLQVLPYVY